MPADRSAKQIIVHLALQGSNTTVLDISQENEKRNHMLTDGTTERPVDDRLRIVYYHDDGRSSFLAADEWTITYLFP